MSCPQENKCVGTKTKFELCKPKRAKLKTKHNEFIFALQFTPETLKDLQYSGQLINILRS